MLYLLGCNSESSKWNDLSRSGDSQPEFGRLLKASGMTDFAILATCHRWECYWHSEENRGAGEVKELISANLLSRRTIENGDFYFKAGPAVVDHLFRVSAGLDSLIIGEHEILGQVRSCLKEALKQKTAGPVVGTLFREAVSIGKKVRRQTAIGRGKASYASLILDLVDRNPWLLPLERALIIGTGKLAGNVAEVLAKQGVKPCFVGGRNPEKAAALAGVFHGEWAPLEQLPGLLQKFSLVIGVSKANRILVAEEDLAAVSRRQMIIDLSVPGIVAPGVNRYKNIEYIGFNFVQGLIKENLGRRRDELETAEVLVAGAVEEMVVAIRQRQNQERIYGAQDRLYQEGQGVLNNLLSRIADEGLKQELAGEWNRQLKKLIYLALSSEKNERLGPVSLAVNEYFPLILSMANRRVLVAGGGKVAARKISKLLETRADVTVVAPELAPELAEYIREGKVRWLKSCFEPGQLDNYDLVIAATDNPAVNREVVNAARRGKILANSVDEAVGSDFIFPAIIRRGDLLIAVSTSGKRPALARKIRQELEFLFGQEYGDLLITKDNDN